MRKKNNSLPDAGHFLRKEIDLTDFKNEKLTTKIKRNKPEKPCFFLKISQKILKQKKSSNKISSSKDIGPRNKSNKAAKYCWFSRLKRSR